MFMTNPFAELSALISADVMQMYIIVMAVLVAGGTILDMMHKKSAQYFFLDSAKNAKNAKRTVSTGEKAGLAVATIASEVITSSEFCFGTSVQSCFVLVVTGSGSSSALM